MLLRCFWRARACACLTPFDPLWTTTRDVSTEPEPKLKLESLSARLARSIRQLPCRFAPYDAPLRPPIDAGSDVRSKSGVLADGSNDVRSCACVCRRDGDPSCLQLPLLRSARELLAVGADCGRLRLLFLEICVIATCVFSTSSFCLDPEPPNGGRCHR